MLTPSGLLTKVSGKANRITRTAALAIAASFSVACEEVTKQEGAGGYNQIQKALSAERINEMANLPENTMLLFERDGVAFAVHETLDNNRFRSKVSITDISNPQGETQIIDLRASFEIFGGNIDYRDTEVAYENGMLYFSIDLHLIEVALNAPNEQIVLERPRATGDSSTGIQVTNGRINILNNSSDRIIAFSENRDVPNQDGITPLEVVNSINLPAGRNFIGFTFNELGDLIVLELVAGETLAHYIRANALRGENPTIAENILETTNLTRELGLEFEQAVRTIRHLHENEYELLVTLPDGTTTKINVNLTPSPVVEPPAPDLGLAPDAEQPTDAGATDAEPQEQEDAGEIDAGQPVNLEEVRAALARQIPAAKVAAEGLSPEEVALPVKAQVTIKVETANGPCEVIACEDHGRSLVCTIRANGNNQLPESCHLDGVITTTDGKERTFTAEAAIVGNPANNHCAEATVTFHPQAAWHCALGAEGQQGNCPEGSALVPQFDFIGCGNTDQGAKYPLRAASDDLSPNVAIQVGGLNGPIAIMGARGCDLQMLTTENLKNNEGGNAAFVLELTPLPTARQRAAGILNVEPSFTIQKPNGNTSTFSLQSAMSDRGMTYDPQKPLYILISPEGEVIAIEYSAELASAKAKEATAAMNALIPCGQNLAEFCSTGRSSNECISQAQIEETIQLCEEIGALGSVKTANYESDHNCNTTPGQKTSPEAIALLALPLALRRRRR